MAEVQRWIENQHVFNRVSGLNLNPRSTRRRADASVFGLHTALTLHGYRESVAYDYTQVVHKMPTSRKLSYHSPAKSRLDSKPTGSLV
ncbi:hypothetical protein M8818_003446 [Zalaria obscura]|uniref:Uncharacterized protein n=1 Tax=Zalaria obscura TaxID=2024903 RepID=A0ACC3SEW0_9PEZI